MSSSRKDYPSYINPELNLEPPGAMDHVESDDDDDGESGRYELWTVRIPVDMKVSDLNGIQIDLEALSKNSKRTKKGDDGCGMEISNGKFVISQGDKNENETFRVLVPDSGNGDNESSDNSDSNSDSHSDNFDSDDDADAAATTKQSKKKKALDPNYHLHPSSRGFSRHFNVHRNILSRKTEAELAPIKGPDPIDCTLRHAYCPIQQRRGLKRRWMPLGNPHTATEIAASLVTIKTEEQQQHKVSSDDDDEDEATVPVKKEKVVAKEEKASSPSKKRRSRSNRRSHDGDKAPRAEDAEAAPKTEAAAAPSSKKKKRSRSNSVGRSSSNADTQTATAASSSSSPKKRKRGRSKEPRASEETSRSNKTAKTVETTESSIDPKKKLFKEEIKAEKKAAKKAKKKSKEGKAVKKEKKNNNNKDDALSV